MVHFIIGVAVVILGVWGMLANWMIFSEILKMLVFAGLVGLGVVAILAGIRQLKANE